MYSFIRRVLFSMSAETAHDITIDSMGAAQRLGLTSLLKRELVNDEYTLCGIKFPNRVGLAAGLDKNGEALDALGALGFGHVEVGTVTPLAQPGNPKPRIFRIPEKQALINRMGFNNHGVDALVNNIADRRFKGVLGINIGKNFDTPVEQANSDYLKCLNKVYEHADYIAVNLSSPNTPGLRQLQFGDMLDSLLGSLRERQLCLESQYSKTVPIFVKLAPDMSEQELTMVAQQIKAAEMSGIIATNTTLDRTLVEGYANSNEAGGLSGAPLTVASNEFTAKLRTVVGEDYPLIGVGGIMNEQDARDRIAAGADLIQIYSGFIYGGPSLPKNLAKAIKER